MNWKGKNQDLQSQAHTSDYHCNFVGISSLLSKVEQCDWIIDSGSSHYMAPLRRVLNDIRAIERQ